MNICVPLKLLRWQDIASNFFKCSRVACPQTLLAVSPDYQPHIRTTQFFFKVVLWTTNPHKLVSNPVSRYQYNVVVPDTVI